MFDLKDYKIVLGSKSPRRSQLLSEAGFVFEIRVQDIDETFDISMPVLEVAEDLAKRKAEALRKTLANNEILITADSVVILNDVIFNKPLHFEEGLEMLSALSGRTHTVATGVCLMTEKKTKTFTSLTYVSFDTIHPDEMDYYLLNFKPYDKAGGYGIQDWIGLCKVKSIDGSFSNVMGLPMQEVYEALRLF